MMTMATTQVENKANDESSEAPTPLNPDERFHLLQNERRRLVIKHLHDVESDAEDGRVRMGDVAEQVAAWEHDTTVAQLSSTQRQRVYIPLYQKHLPKLHDAGVIDYNQSRGVIIPTERVDRLVEFVEGTVTAETGTDDGARNDANADDAWNRYYLGASVASAIMLVAGAFSSFPEFLIAATIFTLFSVLSLSQYYTWVSGHTEHDHV